MKHHFQLKIQLSSEICCDENSTQIIRDEMNFQMKMMLQLVHVPGDNRNAPGRSGGHRSLPSEIKYVLNAFKSLE